jgi:hypothetical protein
MAVRWRSLHIVLAFFAFSAIASKASGEASSSGDLVYPATVSRDGTTLTFAQLPDSCFGDDRVAELVLWFDGIETFDARALSLGVDGERAEIPGYRWDERSEWTTLDGAPALVVRIAEGRRTASFGSPFMRRPPCAKRS